MTATTCNTCNTDEAPAAPSLCVRISQLVAAIHAQSLKPAVRKTRVGAGPSAIEVEYNDSSVSALQARLRGLLALPEAQCCPCYREAMGEAGLAMVLDVRAVRVGFGTHTRRECC